MAFKNLQQFLDLEDIKILKSRYCRYIDTKRWEDLNSIFTSDVRFDGFASAPTGSDGRDFIKGVSGRLAEAFTKHHCHTPEINFTSENTARGIWSMSDYMEWPDAIGLDDAPQSRGLFGFGYYEEDYRREADGNWRMSFLRLVRTRLVPLADDHPKALVAAVMPDPAWLGSADSDGV